MKYIRIALFATVGIGLMHPLTEPAARTRLRLRAAVGLN